MTAIACNTSSTASTHNEIVGPKSASTDEGSPMGFWDCNTIPTAEIIPSYYTPPTDDDDDASQTSSNHYFVQQDFSPLLFQSSSGMIPPMTLAVFLSGLALVVNPLFIVAGALTALTASKACYSNDVCNDGQWLRWPFEEEEEYNNIADDDEKVPQRVASEVSSGYEDVPLTTQVLDAAELEEDSEISLFLETTYPRLVSIAKDNIRFTGLDALEFFDVFFANDAPFSFRELQRKRQDKDIIYGNWKSLHQEGGRASLHPQAAGRANRLQERMLTFQTKTNNFFGPPYAKAAKRERALVASKRLLVIEATTTLDDVPFCDRFYIMERWTVTAEKDFEGVYHTSLKISFEVFFTQSCPFESQIVSSSEKTFKAVSTTWIQMAQQALQGAEQARCKRLMLDELREEIELEQDKKGRIFIVGSKKKKTRISSFKKSLSKIRNLQKRKQSIGRTTKSSFQ